MEDQQHQKPNYSVPAVRTASRILLLLSRKKYHASTLTEISTALSINPTSCFRILKELAAHSFVRFDERNKVYSLGPYLIVLGERAKESLDYISLCIPYMEQLTRQISMTTTLVSRVSEHTLTIVHKVETGDVGIRVSVGRHFHIASGAFGKCFLSYMDEESQRECLEERPSFAALGEAERSAVIDELQACREKGFAVSYNELFTGIFGVAAPIFMHEERMEMCIAAIGLTATHSREDLEHTVGPLVSQCASSVTERLSLG